MLISDTAMDMWKGGAHGRGTVRGCRPKASGANELNFDINSEMPIDEVPEAPASGQFTGM